MNISPDASIGASSVCSLRSRLSERRKRRGITFSLPRSVMFKQADRAVKSVNGFARVRSYRTATLIEARARGPLSLPNKSLLMVCEIFFAQSGLFPPNIAPLCFVGRNPLLPKKYLTISQLKDFTDHYVNAKSGKFQIIYSEIFVIRSPSRSKLYSLIRPSA